jgi:hypothetical protein
MIHQGPAENRRVIGVRVEPPTRSDRSGAQGLPPSTPEGIVETCGGIIGTCRRSPPLGEKEIGERAILPH